MSAPLRTVAIGKAKVQFGAVHCTARSNFSHSSSERGNPSIKMSARGVARIACVAVRAHGGADRLAVRAQGRWLGHECHGLGEIAAEAVDAVAIYQSQAKRSDLLKQRHKQRGRHLQPLAHHHV